MNVEHIKNNTSNYINKFIHNDSTIMKFYQNFKLDKESIEHKFRLPIHKHTETLANIIEADMSKYELSESQSCNLTRLRNGHRVIIGGQQAGLFVSPVYIIHKIITILTLQREIKEKHHYDAVPVFWIAGEDHDFEEVNHAYVFSQQHSKLKKFSYKPTLNVQMSMGFYHYDKKAMLDVLNQICTEVGDSTHLLEFKEKLKEMIFSNSTWTELFHAIVHELFKEYGVLIFNSHLPQIRQLEIPIFEKLIRESDKIDHAFRTGQEHIKNVTNQEKSIVTNTNTHVFFNSTTNRQLLQKRSKQYNCGEVNYSLESLISQLHATPEEFSNNVVTRPIMQESLFNTLIFVAGDAEVKYWGELYKVFDYLNIEMPIICRRMSITFVDKERSTILKNYDLNFSFSLLHQINNKIEEKLNSNLDETLIRYFKNLESVISKEYHLIEQYIQDNHKALLDIAKSNRENIEKQLHYIQRRYKLENKRSIRSDLNALNSLKDILFPQGVLQERKLHSFHFLKYIDELPPLHYTNDHLLIYTHS